MNRTSPTTSLGIIVAALLGATVAGPLMTSPRAGTTPATTSDSNAKPAADSARTAELRPGCVPPAAWRLQLTDFLVGGTKPVDDSGECNPNALKLPEAVKQIPNLQYLIASVPDPKFSSAGHGCDQRIDALQKAVTRSGYLLDRFHFPWPSGNPERAPGVILFRRPHPVAAAGTAVSDQEAENHPAPKAEPAAADNPPDSPPPAPPAQWGKDEPSEGDEAPMPSPQGVTQTEDSTTPDSDDGDATRPEAASKDAAGADKPSAEKPQADEAEPEKPCAKRDDKPDLPVDILLVFLVGESPTFGIHKQAFAAAVEEIVRIETSRAGDADKQASPSKTTEKAELRIPVVGPSFSGAGESLALAIRNVCKGFLDEDQRSIVFDVTFGSTTALKTKRFQTIAGKSALPPGSVRCTTNPSWFREQILKEFIRDRNPVGGKIQLVRLIESNTGYGNRPSAEPAPKAGQQSDPKPDAQPDPQSGKEPDPQPVQQPDSEFPNIETVDFPFPLHVSRLRSTTPGKPPSLSDLASQSRPVRLAVPINEVTPKSDTLPQLTAAQSSVRDELALDAIVRYVQRHHVDYVLIRATDEYDKLFLARTVAEYCPQARILIEGSSRLLVHPDFAPFLRGALVACTYPLFMSNQEWSFPRHAAHEDQQDRQLLAFSEGHVVAFYNAVVLSMYHMHATPQDTAAFENLIDYGPPFRRSEAGPTRQLAPPVWICVVGHGSLIPLTWREVTETDRENETVLFPQPVVLGRSGKSDDGLGEDYVVPLHFSSSIVVLLTALVIWTGCISFAQSVSWRRPAGMQPLTVNISWSLKGLFGPRIQDGRWRSQSRYLLILNVITWLLVTAGSALLWIPALARWQASGSGAIPPWSVIATVAGSIVGSQMLLLTGPPDPPGRKVSWSRKASRVGWMVAGAGLFVASVLVLVSNYSHHRDMLLLSLLIAAGTWLQTNIALLCWTYWRNWVHWIADWMTDWMTHCLGDGQHRVHVLPEASRVWFFVVGLTGCLVQWLILFCIRMDVLRDSSAGRPLWDAMLLFERSMDWGSGASIFTPCVLLWGAATVWLVCRLQRVTLASRARIDAPWPCPDDLSERTLGQCVKGMSDTHDHIENIVSNPTRTLWTVTNARFAFVFLCLFFWSAWLIRNWSRPALDGGASVVILILLLSLVAVWIHWIWESVFLLSKLRKLLRESAWTPLLAAASRLPDRVRTHMGRFLSPPPTSRRRTHLRVRVHYLKELAETFPRSLLSTNAWNGFDAARLSQADDALAQEIRKRDSQQPAAEIGKAAEATCLLMNDAGKDLFRRLVEHWNESGTYELYPQRTADSTPVKKRSQRDKWLELAEEAVVLQLIAYVQHFLRHLRYMIFGAMLLSLLLSVALLSYPLHPASLLLTTSNLMLLVTAGLGMAAVIIFDRQDLLRNLIGEDAPAMEQRLQTGTTLIGYFVPVALMLLRQFSPNSVSWIVSAFEPLLRSGG